MIKPGVKCEFLISLVSDVVKSKREMNSGIFQLILTCLVINVIAHTEQDKPPRDVFCNYFEDDRGYVCEITKLKLHHESDRIRLTGKRKEGKSNEDVSYLHIHSSESHIVPSEDIFTYLVNLVSLEMRGVSVKKVDQIINCAPLELIILSENEIKSLDAGVFVECSSLEILDLSKNEIFKIHVNAFGSLSALRELDLSFNKIDKLTRKTIKPLKNLKKLSLQSNKLAEINYDTFNDMFHLSELDLSDNPLTRLDFRTFDFTIHIETLKLRSTEIRKFHPFTFKNLRRVRYLDISNTNIRYVSNDMLSTNSELVELRMENCGTRAVGRQFFDKLNKLAVVHASNNKCVDGVFKGDVVDIRAKFIKCMQNWDDIRNKTDQYVHSGEEL